jgi:hypothetical protein
MREYGGLVYQFLKQVKSMGRPVQMLPFQNPWSLSQPLQSWPAPVGSGRAQAEGFVESKGLGLGVSNTGIPVGSATGGGWENTFFYKRTVHGAFKAHPTILKVTKIQLGASEPILPPKHWKDYRSPKPDGVPRVCFEVGSGTLWANWKSSSCVK